MARRRPVARVRLHDEVHDTYAAASFGESVTDYPEHTTPESLAAAAHLVADAAASAGEGAPVEEHALALADRFAVALGAVRAENVGITLAPDGSVGSVTFRVRAASTDARVLARSLVGSVTSLGMVVATDARAANPWVALVELRFHVSTETAGTPTPVGPEPGHVIQ